MPAYSSVRAAPPHLIAFELQRSAPRRRSASRSRRRRCCARTGHRLALQDAALIQLKLRRIDGWWKIAAVLSHTLAHGMAMRRTALTAAVVLGLLATPLAARAQQTGKMVRIGRLDMVSDSADAVRWKAFRERLGELGYVEGQNVVFESRWASGQLGRLPGLAKELVDAKVDILVTATSEAALAAKRATRAIPVVTATGSDPVESRDRRESGAAGRKYHGGLFAEQ